MIISIVNFPTGHLLAARFAVSLPKVSPENTYSTTSNIGKFSSLNSDITSRGINIKNT